LIDTDANELAEWAPKLLTRLQTLPEVVDVASDQQDNGYRTVITVDRAAAMRLGVSMQAVEDTLYDSFGQRQISTIFGQANQYRIILEADPSWRRLRRRSSPSACPEQSTAAIRVTQRSFNAPLPPSHG
jgi:multidrug efflux pump